MVENEKREKEEKMVKNTIRYSYMSYDLNKNKEYSCKKFVENKNVSFNKIICQNNDSSLDKSYDNEKIDFSSIGFGLNNKKKYMLVVYV